jgi:hypothetical protein
MQALLAVLRPLRASGSALRASGSALRVPATVLRFPQMAVGCAVANKENKATVNNKKVGKSPKEKKAAKAAKNEERTAERKAWEK